MPKSAPGCGVVVAGGSCPRCCRGGAGGAGAFNGVQVLGALGLAVGGEDFNASAFPFKKVLLASSRFQTQYGFATVGDLVPASSPTPLKHPSNELKVTSKQENCSPFRILKENGIRILRELQAFAAANCPCLDYR
jgi:hypothetical protein